MVEFSNKTIWAWLFLFWKLLSYKFSFLNNYKAIQIICCILGELWLFFFFEALVHFFKLSSFMHVELIVSDSNNNALIILWSVQGLCVARFIPDVGNSYLLFFSMSVILEVRQFYWCFQRTVFVFHWFSIFFHFQLYWFFFISYLFLSVYFLWVYFALLSLGTWSRSLDYWFETSPFSILYV